MLRGFIVWVGNREQDTADRLLSALWVAAADSSSLLLWMMWISQLCLVIHSWSVICCCPVRVSQLSMMYFSCIGFVRVWVPLKLSALVTVAGVSHSLHVNDERCHLDVTRWFVGCCLEPLNVEAHTFFLKPSCQHLNFSSKDEHFNMKVCDWLTHISCRPQVAVWTAVFGTSMLASFFSLEGEFQKCVYLEEIQKKTLFIHYPLHVWCCILMKVFSVIC